jgi:hypothetical protein
MRKPANHRPGSTGATWSRARSASSAAPAAGLRSSTRAFSAPSAGPPISPGKTSSGLGVVYATTAVYRREGDPYNVILVDLEEGFRMMSRVEGVPAERVEVGARVTLRVDREGEDPVPVFVLRDEDR